MFLLPHDQDLSKTAMLRRLEIVAPLVIGPGLNSKKFLPKEKEKKNTNIGTTGAQRQKKRLPDGKVVL